MLLPFRVENYHLDIARVFSLAKNVEKVFIGEEVEARELLAFVLQIVVEGLLDFLQVFVHVIEPVQQSGFAYGLQCDFCHLSHSSRAVGKWA